MRLTLVPPPVEVSNGGVDGDLALLLVLVKVGRGVAVVHFAEAG